MARETCPAMLMITSSPAPDSASSVTSVWRLSCTKLRTDTFLGFPVTVVLMQSGNSIRVTHWRAAAFGCMSLKYIVERLAKDGTTWATTYEGRAISAKLGEPDQRLFDLGADYETVTDAETDKRLSADMEKFKPGSSK